SPISRYSPADEGTGSRRRQGSGCPPGCVEAPPLHRQRRSEMVKKLFVAAALAGLGLSGLAATPASACDDWARFFEQRRTGEFTGVLEWDWCGAPPSKGVYLRTGVIDFRLVFTQDADAAEAKKLLGTKVKVTGRLKSRGLEVQKLEVVK